MPLLTLGKSTTEVLTMITPHDAQRYAVVRVAPEYRDVIGGAEYGVVTDAYPDGDERGSFVRLNGGVRRVPMSALEIVKRPESVIPRDLMHTVFHHLVSTLRTDGQRTEALTLRGQAVGYVWGYQDGSRSAERDTDTSIAFGYAFGIHALMHIREAAPSRRNIGDAYRAWCLSGDVNGDLYPTS